jgi:hypothetical protein
MPPTTAAHGGLATSMEDHERGRPLLRAHIWLVASIIPLLDRLLPLRWLLRVLTPPARFRPYARVPADEIEKLIDRRLAGAINMRRRACLRKGLTLFHFLRLAGRQAVISFAVYPPGEAARRIRGHCWVTSEGRDFGERPDSPHVTVMEYGR